MERIASGYRYTAGPVWSHDGFLLFSDLPSDRVLVMRPGEPVAIHREHAGGISGAAYDAQGRLYTCESAGRRVVRIAAKKTDVLGERWDGKRLNGPDEIAIRRDGHAYFTDPAFGSRNDARELDFYGIFHLSSKGDLNPIARWKTRPTGITLSPNGKLLYVADADRRLIQVFDVDHNGEAAGERTLISRIEGVPLGIRTDEKGNLYVAARSVLIYSAAGKLTSTLELAETPSHLAFGDNDFQGLYVTARQGLYRIRLGVKGAQNHSTP